VSGYGAWVLKRHGFPPETRTLKEALTIAIEQPTRSHIIGAGLLVYGFLEATEPDAEAHLFLLDMRAILQVERDWLFEQETRT
jgi:hypothetical protein